ncbi:MAG: YetF domain-containing protein [Pseudomonadota bacterium]
MVVQTILQTLLAVAFIIVLVRINGLRSFSKMSSFDFALTVATGSVLASMATSATFPTSGFIALAVLFAVRFVISALRQHSDLVENATDNRPLMLMHNGRFLDRNLSQSRVSRSDVIAKLREANAIRLSEVHAVVLEATGDVSVLHGTEDIDEVLLNGVSWGAHGAPMSG